MKNRDFASILLALVLAIMGVASVGSHITRMSETATIKVVNCHGGTCDKTTVTFENVGQTNPDTLNYYAKQLIEALK